MGKVIIVHSLAQAMAAAQVAETNGQPLTICSAPGGGGNLGTGWFAALGDLVREHHPGLGLTIFIDCSNNAGVAMGALRRGLNVIFTGHDRTFESLGAIAAPLGLSVRRETIADLDLLDVLDSAAACRDLLGGDGA